MGQRHSKTTNPENVDEKDIIIAVVGQIGVGKSTFINVAGGKDVVSVGSGLKQVTVEIEHVECTITRDNEQQRVIFVDTPGFDSVKPREVEKKLKSWLKKMSSKKLTIFGVLYLQRIMDNRLTSPPAIHLSMMETLCKESLKGFPNRVVLVTTMWGKHRKKEEEESQEQKLQEYWDSLPWAKGSAASRVMRFDGTPENAESIIDTLMGRQ